MGRAISVALLWRSICILFLITSLAATTTSLSFFLNFSDPGTFSNGDLNFDGDAYAANGSIIVAKERLTGNTTSRSGRVSYKRPVRLRSNASGEVSGFSASFSFVINGRQRQAPIDTGGGLAFFLAPYPSRMPPNSEGGYLGLFDRTTVASSDWMLAVEVDSHGDLGWDPTMSPHIGVDLNTLHSGKKSYKAVGELVDGAPYVLQVDYSDVTKDLFVVLRSSSSSSSSSTAGVPLVALKKSIDLSAFLPSESEVAIGISAATGGSNLATHHLLWWSYETSTDRSINLSSLISAADAPGTLVDPESPPPPVDTDLASATSGGWNHRAVLVGVVVFAVLATVTGTVVALLCALSRSTFRVRYGSDISLGLSGDILLPISERKPPQIYRERELTIRVILVAAFYGWGKMIKYLMLLFMRSNKGLRNDSASISLIQQLRHQNLQRAQLCSTSTATRLLVYEYIPKSDHVVYQPSLLTWPMRLKLALDVGSALEHQHGHPRPVRHGNTRPDNVLLDDGFSAKLTDLGCARLLVNDLESLKASPSDDVFWFGALLLDLVRGRRCPTGASACINNHEEVKAALLEYSDQCLDGQFDREEVHRVMLVGLLCSHPEQRQRPSIAQALRYLRSEDPLPSVPLRMPEVHVNRENGDITEQASKLVANFWSP